MQASGFPPSAGVADSEELAAPIDIRSMIGGVLRRWKLIVAVPLLLLLAAYGVLKVVPPRYQADVQILMFDPQLPGAGVTGQQQSPLREFDTVAINTEIEVMQSTQLLLSVVKDLKLDENPEFQRQSRIALLLERIGVSSNGWIVENLRNLLGAVGIGSPNVSNDHPETAGDVTGAAEDRLETAADILSQHLRIERVPLSYVLSVSATSSSPDLAQRIASTLVNNYLADEQEARKRALDQVALWLKGKLTELKSQVVETETAMEKLKAASGLSDTGKGSVVEQQIADLNAQLMLVRADAAEKRARLDQARQLAAGNGHPQDIPTGVASPVITQLRLQQSLLTRQLAQLRAKLGDSHAEVQAVATQLAGVNKAISDEAAHVLTDLQNSYDIAVRREQSVESSMERLTAAQGNSGDRIKLQQLQRVAEADSRLYDTYLARYNEIETTKSLGNPNERVISPAQVPTDPVFPRRKVFFIGAGVLGVGLGGLLAFALHFLQAGAKMGAAAERAYGYPVVGNLPLVPQQGRRRFLRQASNRSMAQTIVGEPLSPFSEAVRTIRIGLRLSSPDHGPKVILVTSSLAGEGKSTVATLLAASSASAGHRTVLVDCDVRGRTISQDYGKQQPGLTDVLSGTADLAAVTVHDPNVGCHVIPAGSSLQSPGDLLASPRMVETIARLRTQYDYIVVDSPPLLSVVDALALATIADKILMTIDGSYAHDVSVAEAFKLLRPETRRIAGMVFNKVPAEQMRHYGLYQNSRYAYPNA